MILQVLLFFYSVTWASSLLMLPEDTYLRETRAERRPCKEAAALIMTVNPNEWFSKIQYDRFRFILDIDDIPVAKFEELLCHFLDDSTVDFLYYARQNGIVRKAIQRIYDFFVVVLEVQADWPSSDYASAISLAAQTNFTDFDAEGVQKAYDFFAKAEGIELTRKPIPAPEADAPVATCADLDGWTIEMRHDFDIPDDFSDEDLVALLCDAILAQSIEDVVEVVDNSGLLEASVDALRNWVQETVAQVKESEPEMTPDWSRLSKQEQEHLRLAWKIFLKLGKEMEDAGTQI